MIIRRSAWARSKLVFLLGLLAATPALGSPTPENPFEELAAIGEARLVATAGRAEAVGPLLGLLELAQVLPRGRLDAAIQRVVDRSGDPLVAARARDWLARRSEERGDDAAAAHIREPLGLLTRFWVVGPFGDGRASIGVTYPPETEVGEPDATRIYPGKERNVGWRRADGAIRRGALDLSALLRPDTQAAAYVLAFVRADRATDAALRLGTPGPVKIWCNGQLVHAADQIRSARLDQDAVGLRLRTGWNRLLIKTVVTGGAWRLFARLTAPGGGPVSFTNEWEAPPSVAPAAGQRSGPSGVPGGTGRAARVVVRALEPILRERVRTARSPDVAGQAALDLGRYLLLVDPADRDQKAAARAFEIAVGHRPTVEALMGLANAGREEDESRRALERALAVAKTPRDRARVLSALGDVARDQRRETFALERWRAALVADARWWPAALSLAGEEQSAGFPGTALARIDNLPAAIRAVPVVARERARLLMALGRRLDAEEAWKVLLADAQDDVDLLRDLATGARERGDGVQSIQLLQRAASLRPELPSLAVDWARALEGARDGAAARVVLEGAARRLPHEPILAAELGRLLDRSGDTARAAEWLRLALELRPQDPDLRRYADGVGARLSSRRPGSTLAGVPDVAGPVGAGARGDLPRRFALPVPPLLEAERARGTSGRTKPSARDAPAASTASTANAADPDPAVVLLDRRAVRVHPNGLSEVFAQRVVEVRTDGGARDNKEFLVRYTPGSEEVEILEARIFRRGPGGALDVLQASERDDQDLSEPWYGLYYDYRAEVVVFEGLRAGDVLEVQYLVSDVSRGNELAGYFGDLQFIAEAVPKRRWDYALLAPPARDFHFARPVVAGFTETTSTSDDGQERVTQFTARDVPRIEVEPAMPGIGEVSPYLHVSTYGSWDDVGTWYWRLVEEQLVPDDTVRVAAQTAIRSAETALRSKGGRAMTIEDKVRALHALVLGGTRYVGLEFGIHGFKPYKVSQVLARRFGDCKDKAALLVAMLTQVGIDAEMVLLRTRRGGRIAPAPASLAVFDHAIVFVPKLNLYLDGTAEFSGMKELPGQDQGVMVLRVGPRGSKLVETPILPSADNRARRVWNVRLKADGAGEVEEQLAIDGQAAPDWRSHYQTPGERIDRYAKVWTGRHPGARLESVEMLGIDDRNRPVTVNAKANVPRLAEATPDGGLLLMLGTRDTDLVRTYARLSNRRSDLVLAYPWRHEETITYQLPAGYHAPLLPKDRLIQNRFGRFELRVEKRGTGLVVDARLDVARERIAAADYEDFRHFLADVDTAMSERIVVERAREAK